MSWLLKQAEDILNRVDQQTNAAIHQHGVKSTGNQTKDDLLSNTPVTESTIRNTTNSINRISASNRRLKKSDDSQFIDYLNSPTSTDSKPTRPLTFNSILTDATRTSSVPDMLANQSSKTPDKFSSKSASGTPRSMTPHDEDQGIILVSVDQLFSTLLILSCSIFHEQPNSNLMSMTSRSIPSILPI